MRVAFARSGRWVRVLAVLLPAATPADAAVRDVARRLPSSLLPPGQSEWRTFHGVYTQTHFFDDGGSRRGAGARSTYYTGTWTVTLGAEGWNPGVEVTLRSVRDSAFPAGAGRRTALTALEPRVKTAPFGAASDLAVEAGLRFPVRRHLEGSADEPFLDWDGPIGTVRAFLDRRWSGAFFVYLEAATQWRYDPPRRDLQLTTPAGAILNWIPSPRWTVYVPVSAAMDWIGEPRGNYWSQTGLGVKFRPRGDLEIELLGTTFPLGRNAGAGVSANLGLRLLR